ncbi:hypothetical protein E3N88_32290 [Mikania micrantha]|uniref:Uncharacterized protein n=1 Tax=Mikania micrantha TaxID=192012 RepID=A0A5N6M9C1_9ASTR|nr:hypothetical protein E3N88_32290 [Mikania micrantha]
MIHCTNTYISASPAPSLAVVSRKVAGAITCGSIITYIDQHIGRFSLDIRDSITKSYARSLLGHNSVMPMPIAAKIPCRGLGFHWIGRQLRSLQFHIPSSGSHNRRSSRMEIIQHHVVGRQPRLHPADAAILREHATRIDRMKHMIQWLVEQQAASSGIYLPIFPRQMHDPCGHA